MKIDKRQFIAVIRLFHLTFVAVIRMQGVYSRFVRSVLAFSISHNVETTHRNKYIRLAVLLAAPSEGPQRAIDKIRLKRVEKAKEIYASTCVSLPLPYKYERRPLRAVHAGNATMLSTAATLAIRMWNVATISRSFWPRFAVCKDILSTGQPSRFSTPSELLYISFPSFYISHTDAYSQKKKKKDIFTWTYIKNNIFVYKKSIWKKMSKKKCPHAGIAWVWNNNNVSIERVRRHLTVRARGGGGGWCWWETMKQSAQTLSLFHTSRKSTASPWTMSLTAAASLN